MMPHAMSRLLFLWAAAAVSTNVNAEPSLDFAATTPGAKKPLLVIDMVIPVAPKDATVVRFTLRHALKYAQHLRNIYLVCTPTLQLESIAHQTNAHFVAENQRVVIVDEAKFPFSINSIRTYLRHARPTEGFDGRPFDGVVVTPQKCLENKPLTPLKQSIHACRQRYGNETSPEQLGKAKWGVIKKETFDRAGWMYQQFLKLGCNRDIIPRLSDAYWVLDSDTVFYNAYSPFPPKSNGTIYNYMPGDGRDCGNSPYYMTLNALGIKADWKGSAYSCVGKDATRKCRTRQLCPIAHQMIYSQKVGIR